MNIFWEILLNFTENKEIKSGQTSLSCVWDALSKTLSWYEEYFVNNILDYNNYQYVGQGDNSV